MAVCRHQLTRFRRYLIVVLFSLASCANLEPGEKKPERIVADSMGELILYQDELNRYKDGSNFFGPGFYLSVKLEDIYRKRIVDLPLEDRISFFWSVMVNIDMNGTYLEDFYWLLFDDCGFEFIGVIDDFLDKSDSIRKSEVYARAEGTQTVLRLIARVKN